jgi:hypothetical protein
VIHGKVIQLEREPGLPDGEVIMVTVEPVVSPRLPIPSVFLSEEARVRIEAAWDQVKDLPPGEGLRQAFGAWADDVEEVDRFVEWNYAQRRLDRRTPEL